MSDYLQWNGTSLRIPRDDKWSNIIDFFLTVDIPLRDNRSYYTLENDAVHFIYENKYLAQSKNILTNIKKYSQKNYESNMKVFSEIDLKFYNVSAKSNDKEKYLRVIANNILDGDYREIIVSPNVLNEVFDNSVQSRVFLDILLLFFLANKCKYDAETVWAEFNTEEGYYQVRLDLIKSNPLNLYPLYNWIINDEEYEGSFEVKLQIVRQVIAIRKDLINIDELLEDCKLSFKRIISKKTNDYFEQINKLKDDFLIMSKSESSALRTLNLTFFAWLGSLGVKLFDIITKYDGDDILVYFLYSSGAKKGIVILLFIIALILIFIGYVLEVKSLEKTYVVIKETYKDKILFEKNQEETKFEKMITKPKIGRIQAVVFIFIIIILSCRFFITLPW
ncbi:hypothetical protein PT103_05305 [Erysipelothrix rhusiopathiae]|nr:hypothetical protein [Erysipelothrix rhusiopathiae]UPU38906.1 hypothetical protein MX850_10090 [Erysipelothrix sp. Poltava]